VVLGLDVGSSYTKGILYDEGVKQKLVVKTSFKPKQAIQQIKAQLVGYSKITATGFGRELVTDADKIITEITAFARGAAHFDPSTRTIIDIGGQDSKVIKIRDARVDRFVMNDRCAAGTGNFVEKIAQALDLTLKEFGELALAADRSETIDSLCVVMAETEILSLIGEGKALEDIVAGVCDALVRRIDGIGSQIGIEEPILFCGGGALNPGLVKSMQRIFGDVTIPEDPQFVGAVGATLSL
jgi:predicted CoA-substrate-specific enzyme activase